MAWLIILGLALVILACAALSHSTPRPRRVWNYELNRWEYRNRDL